MPSSWNEKNSAEAAMSMRSNISPGSSHVSVQKSPVPYLLGGVGAMVVLIAFAVIILALSYFRECTSGNAEAADSGKNEKREDMAELSDEMGELRVIVIMAGNEKPTFIAKPTSVPPVSVS